MQGQGLELALDSILEGLEGLLEERAPIRVLVLVRVLEVDSIRVRVLVRVRQERQQERQERQQERQLERQQERQERQQERQEQSERVRVLEVDSIRVRVLVRV